jgi:hypothetical protein
MSFEFLWRFLPRIYREREDYQMLVQNVGSKQFIYMLC